MQRCRFIRCRGGADVDKEVLQRCRCRCRGAEPQRCKRGAGEVQRCRCRFIRCRGGADAEKEMQRYRCSCSGASVQTRNRCIGAYSEEEGGGAEMQR